MNINGVLVFNKNDRFLKEIIQSQQNTSNQVLEVDKSSGNKFINDNNYLKGRHNSINTSIAIILAKKLNIQNPQLNQQLKAL